MPRITTSGLVTGKVHGNHLVHLFHAGDQESLCNRLMRPRPTTATSFRAAPCGACLAAALTAGQTCAIDGGTAWINLARLSPT